ncbi:MAG TPA: hypothetical protein VF121_19845 [Thermoanaerobaculia bacterium]|nr:hypothetical protein [Thermoanaerobaculia bacterium]
MLSVAVLAAALAAAAAPPGGWSLLIEEIPSRGPALTDLHEVAAGEAVYWEAVELVQDVAILGTPVHAEPVVQNSPTVARGERLVGYRAATGEIAFCAPSARPRHFNCLQDLDLNGAFEWFFSTPLRGKKRLPRPVGYLRVKVPFLAADAPPGVGLSPLRREIAYDGVAGGVARLAYREYAGDGDRPALVDEIRVELLVPGPTMVSVRGAQLEIFDADGSRIRYRVMTRFRSAT